MPLARGRLIGPPSDGCGRARFPYLTVLPVFPPSTESAGFTMPGRVAFSADGPSAALALVITDTHVDAPTVHSLPYDFTDDEDQLMATVRDRPSQRGVSGTGRAHFSHACR